MDNKKSLFIFLGFVLVIIQIVSFIGMSLADIDLYPDNDDLPWSLRIDDISGLNAMKAIFAVEAGIDRFSTSFKDITYFFKELSNGYEYRPMESTQMTSAMIRESLGCSDGGSVGLAVYDTILTLSYSIVGILGIILLIVGNKIHD